MAKNFAGTIMPSPVQLDPDNSVFRPRPNNCAIGGRKGGKNKAAKQRLLKRKAYERVYSAWLKWRQKHPRGKFASVAIFWELEAQEIFDELKTTDRKAAKMLRSKGGLGFVTTKTMRQNIREFEAQHRTAQTKFSN